MKAKYHLKIPSQKPSYGLANGVLGLIESQSVLPRRHSARHLQNAANALAKSGNPFLFEGLAGIVASREFTKLTESAQDQWIQAILAPRHQGLPELIQGEAGILLACLNSSRVPAAQEAGRVKSILRQIQSGPKGSYWCVPEGEHLFRLRQKGPQVLEKYDLPLGALRCTVDLGFAHGLSGTLFVLSKYLVVRQSKSAEIRRAILGMAKYLLQQIEHAPQGFLPGFSYQHRPFQSSARPPMFWCYGNPGVSLGLLWAAWGLNSDVIQGQAWSLFKTWNAYLRNRPKELARIGVTFCHGFAGLAEISRFFFALTAEPYAEDCWQYWVTHLRTKNKLAGALQGGLLEGTLGVRATIACAHQRDSHNPWSRLFGTSLGAPALADESPRLAE